MFVRFNEFDFAMTAQRAQQIPAMKTRGLTLLINPWRAAQRQQCVVRNAAQR